MSHFIPTLELLAALKTKCAGLELSAGVALFEQVRYFTTPDLMRACRELHSFAARACFLVPSGDDFENSFSGRDLRSGCSRQIILLLTDRSQAAAAAATVGGERNAGVVAMKDLLVEALLGEQLDFGPKLVRLRPVESNPLLITVDDAKKQPGRQAWQMTWLADAGQTSVTPTL